jgi:hypothetical protein
MPKCPVQRTVMKAAELVKASSIPLGSLHSVRIGRDASHAPANTLDCSLRIKRADEFLSTPRGLY